MIFAFFALAVAIAFFVSSLLLLHYGRSLGLRYLQQEGTPTMTGLTTVESAVFALIGLLLAFTISGALQRFDERRQLVVQEANAISTAYDRLALFDPHASQNLQARLKDYLRARIDLYRLPRDFSVFDSAEVWSHEHQNRIFTLKTELWQATLAACPETGFRPACLQSLPALSNVFEIARLRAGAAEKHPPRTIYLMLFSLGLGGSLLAGFGMAAARTRSWVHMMMFAATLGVTLYVVMDIEFPRLGLIRLDDFDHFLTEAYDRMR